MHGVFTEIFLDKLNRVEEQVFLVKTVPGMSETLLIEYGITGVMLSQNYTKSFCHY